MLQQYSHFNPEWEGSCLRPNGCKQRIITTNHSTCNSTSPCKHTWGPDGRRVRQAAGVTDLRVHDLRRSVGSWMSQSGVDLNKIKEALRHASISTTLTYARLSEDAAREPMEEHGQRIMEAAGRKGPRSVIDGGRRGADGSST